MPRTKQSFRLNPRFSLDNNKANVVFLISSRLFPGGRFSYALGIPAKPSEWDTSKGKFRVGKTFPMGERRNKMLNRILSKVREVTEKADGSPINKEVLRRELDKLLGRIPTLVEKDFFDFYNSEIEINRKSWKTGSIKALKTTFNQLKKFEKETNYFISFATINLDFHAKFTNWLNAQNYAKNYVGKQIRNIRTILNMAEDLNYPVNPDFHKKSFKVLREESDNVYLTTDELNQLKEFQYDDPSHERCRDLFLFLCNTALRISDAKRINESHVFDDYIMIKAIKTYQNVTIPLNREAKRILGKYDNNLPSFADQYFNRLLKVICRAAGIDKSVTITKTKGGMRVDAVKKKWELVSSHTGRRSFATNRFLEKMPIQEIMAYTGHKTESVFRQYVKADQLTVIREMTKMTS
ncbi:MAG: site-specific integrase [Ekhidna sp.]